MPQGIEKSTGRGAALRKVVRFRRIDLGLPEMVVLLGDEPVVDAREFAVRQPCFCRCYSCPGLSLGIEDPSTRRASELVSLREGTLLLVQRWEEEENISVCYGEIEDDVSIVVLIATRDMPMECYDT